MPFIRCTRLLGGQSVVDRVRNTYLSSQLIFRIWSYRLRCVCYFYTRVRRPTVYSRFRKTNFPMICCIVSPAALSHQALTVQELKKHGAQCSTDNNTKNKLINLVATIEIFHWKLNFAQIYTKWSRVSKYQKHLQFIVKVE